MHINYSTYQCKVSDCQIQWKHVQATIIYIYIFIYIYIYIYPSLSTKNGNFGGLSNFFATPQWYFPPFFHLHFGCPPLWKAPAFHPTIAVNPGDFVPPPNSPLVPYYWTNLTRWWFETFLIFTTTWGNDPIWQAYFSTGLVQPPTKINHDLFSFRTWNSRYTDQ